MTFSELLRAALERELAAARPPRDPIFQFRPAPRDPRIPRDLSEKHDRYLYGPKT